MIIVNAYGQPQMAARIESAIGKAMAITVKAEGHRPALPASKYDKSHVRPRNFDYQYDDAVLNYIKKNPGCRMRDIIANANLDRANVESVFRRLFATGEIVRKYRGSKIPYFFLAQDAIRSNDAI